MTRGRQVNARRRQAGPLLKQTKQMTAGQGQGKQQAWVEL